MIKSEIILEACGIGKRHSGFYEPYTPLFEENRSSRGDNSESGYFAYLLDSKTGKHVRRWIEKDSANDE